MHGSAGTTKYAHTKDVGASETPMQTFLDAMPIAKENMIAA